MTRFTVFVGALLVSCLQLTAVFAASDSRTDCERSTVERWRAARVAELTSEDGWLTLVGLFWLDAGTNTFGRATANHIVLDHPALAEMAGSFELVSQRVRFTADPAGHITHEGQPVATIEMSPDTQPAPTILSSGPLRFYIIERAGKLGVRVRDVDSPRRTRFKPIDYFPVDTGWVIEARFESYEPHRHIRIVNILGMEQDMDSPGALLFRKDGHEWRLDAVLEAPDDPSLFVMFADGTSGKESYGGGRFLHVALPQDGAARIDFNQSYNPPCAFNDFATCPLPPYQNHLALRVTAGERSYGTEQSHRGP